MAGGSVSDEWMYNEVLDDDFPLRGSLSEDRIRSGSVDSTDLLDDVLTLPSAAPVKSESEDVEQIDFVNEGSNGTQLEDSGSARYKADQMAKTVQARISANRTSQSIDMGAGLSVYSREPNRKSSVFVGNLTWWTSDLDVIKAVKDAGLGEVKMIKFFENRTNGQSKGFCLVELANDALALGGPEKLQEISLHGQKIISSYAGRMSVHQFEAKSLGKPVPDKAGLTNKSVNRSTPHTNSAIFNSVVPTPPIRPPLPVLNFPPTIPPLVRGLRPPGVPDLPPLPPPFPPVPPANPILPRLPLPASLVSQPTFPPPLPPVDHTSAAAAAAAAAYGANKPAAPHLNPAFLHDMPGGSNMAELFAKVAARFQGQAQALSGLGTSATKITSDEEASDANQRNRAISSSAITRAMSDANTGDYESAFDTLKMAITLIKQSVTANSESSLMLIQSLQDCLQSIERLANRRYKGSSSSSTRSRHDHRDSRSTHRSSSSRHHRDRSRERR